MIDGRISQANGRLKSAGVRVRIERHGGKLILRATLPPRPGATRIDAHQQRVAVGFNANPHGVTLAEKEARLIDALLQSGEFNWSRYVKNDVQKPLTVGAWVERFERDYFTRRDRNPKSETTWRHDYLKVFKTLDANDELTHQLMREAIAQTKPDTRTRKRYVDVLSRLAKFAGIEADFKPLQGNYSPKRVSPRNLPTDDAIALWRDKIPNAEWQRVYGLIAVYGLRPHEVFLCSLDRLPILEIFDETKTGSRLVYPYYPEWATGWNLIGTLPEVTGKTNSDLGSRVTHAFRRYKVPFKPYDLRHCWAVRTIRFGLPDTLAARQMGHSVQVHTEIYHAWITADEQDRMYQLLMQRGDRPRPPSAVGVTQPL